MGLGRSEEGEGRATEGDGGVRARIQGTRGEDGRKGDAPTRIWVVWGTKDDMVPQKGRKHLRRVLLDLVAEGDWVKLAGKGHEDILTLSCVMEPVFEEAQN